MATSSIVPGISTLGIRLAYGLGTSLETAPTSFKLLDRINSIGGISLDVESIDASALEDSVSSSVAGRADTGGTFPISVNLSTATIAQWESLISEYNARGEKFMWFQIYSPNMEKAFYVVGEPPQQIPMPESNQNELWVGELNITIVKYVGLLTKVAPATA